MAVHDEVSLGRAEDNVSVGICDEVAGEDGAVGRGVLKQLVRSDDVIGVQRAFGPELLLLVLHAF